MLKKTHECFNVSIEDKVAHIVLNRPQAMNAMNKAFWNELPRIVREIDRDALARVIVISSTGKHFSAGMDLSVFGSPGSVSNPDMNHYTAAEVFRSNISKIQSSFNALEEARIPVLIACQGGVIGGAMDMISAADIRWCTKDAFFCIQETNIAMTADVGTFPRLQRYVPEGWVKQMACKTLINYGRDHSTADTLDYIGVWNAGMMPHSHMKEAFTAMAEKREPVFPDLGKLRDDPM